MLLNVRMALGQQAKRTISQDKHNHSLNDLQRQGDRNDTGRSDHPVDVESLCITNQDNFDEVAGASVKDDHYSMEPTSPEGILYYAE